MIGKAFFENEAAWVAENLIGKIVAYNGKSAVITETEAYGDDDPFCYGVRHGKTANNYASFMKGGYVFVYAGMLMITTGKNENRPQNVLIRAANIPECNGPYNLGKYFGITKELRGKAVGKDSGLSIEEGVSAKVTTEKRGKFCKSKVLEDYIKRYPFLQKQAEEKIEQYADIPWRFISKSN